MSYSPAAIAAHNAIAPPAAQIQLCRECGRPFTGPGWAGWRIDGDGQAYARTRMCSERCVNADLEPSEGAHPSPLSFRCLRENAL